MYPPAAYSILPPEQSSRHLNSMAKRAFDILVSIVALIVLGPVFGLIALAIKRDSPGPVFYRGPRLGLGGKMFYILKFRTMYEEPESYCGPRVTACDDPRVTSLGCWLRATKLNELPQFWNVLKGEMSLVGPRPEDPEIVRTWPEEARREVLSVRPGVTSPASVQFRNEEQQLISGQVMYTYMEQIKPTKLRLDQLYVRNHSFWLDIDVIFWTFLVLLPKLGSFTPPEDSLFWGPISRLVQRYLNWFTIDALITFMAFGIVGVVWRLGEPLNVGWLKAISISLGFAIIFSLTGAAMGVNRIAWSKAVATDVFFLLPAAVLAAIFVYWINRLVRAFPDELVMMASALAIAGFITARYRERLFQGIAERLLRLMDATQTARERVLIIGSGLSGELTAWMLEHPSVSRGLRLVGFVDDDTYKQGARICGVDVLGKRQDIPDLVQEYDVGILIFAIHKISAEERSTILEICQSTPARLVVVPDLLAILDQIALPPRPAPGLSTWEGETEIAISGNGSLPCSHCLLRYVPEKMVYLLSDLQRLAQDGDLKAVQRLVSLFLEQYPVVEQE
jgi:lipopolysaccharide/colanic/teichoic acid biosynthesis glycosyltransferase